MGLERIFPYSPILRKTGERNVETIWDCFFDRDEQMKRATCPECDDWINFPSRTKVGQRFLCESCQSELVVIRTSPLELDWAFLEPFQQAEGLGKKDDTLQK